MAAGGVDTGWTFTTPLSTHYVNTNVLTTGLAVFIAGFSSIFTGLNFIVTIHKMRAPGMTWFRLPLFVWAHYAASILMVLGTPVVAIAIVLMALERTIGIGVFDPTKGGDPLLFQHLFWFYSHPAVYIMILPGMGVISEVISTFSRKRVFGYTAVAFSSVAIAVFGFFVWAHHMFIMGISNYAVLVFSLLTMLVAVPSAIKIFNWTFTLYKGSITFETPMLYAFGFMGLFTIGGLTGVFLGTSGTDIHLTETYFIVAHFHFVMVGGMLMAFLAGIHFWWPKMTGRMYPEKLSQLAARGHFHRVQLHLLSAVHSGRAGHAAALRFLSAGVSDTECVFDSRRHHSGRGLHAAGALSDVVAEVRRHCRQQSLAGYGAGMADPVAAVDGKLYQDAHHGPRSLRLRVAGKAAGERGGQCRIAPRLPMAPKTRLTTSTRPICAITSNSTEQQADATNFAMWLFLLTEVMFFGGLFTAYLIYRNWYYPAFVAGFAPVECRLGHRQHSWC